MNLHLIDFMRTTKFVKSRCLLLNVSRIDCTVPVVRNTVVENSTIDLYSSTEESKKFWSQHQTYPSTKSSCVKRAYYSNFLNLLLK